LGDKKKKTEVSSAAYCEISVIENWISAKLLKAQLMLWLGDTEAGESKKRKGPHQYVG